MHYVLFLHWHARVRLWWQYTIHIVNILLGALVCFPLSFSSFSVFLSLSGRFLWLNIYCYCHCYMLLLLMLLLLCAGREILQPLKCVLNHFQMVENERCWLRASQMDFHVWLPFSAHTRSATRFLHFFPSPFLSSFSSFSSPSLIPFALYFSTLPLYAVTLKCLPFSLSRSRSLSVCVDVDT